MHQVLRTNPKEANKNVFGALTALLLAIGHAGAVFQKDSIPFVQALVIFVHCMRDYFAIFLVEEFVSYEPVSSVGGMRVPCLPARPVSEPAGSTHLWFPGVLSKPSSFRPGSQHAGAPGVGGLL